MDEIFKQIDDMTAEAIKNADTETLGEKLQKKRELLGLKMIDISRISGLSESLIGKIEGDKIDDIRISTLKRLCVAYEVSPKLFIDLMAVNDSVERMKEISKTLSDARRALK
jgi:transcriptional regulator with XRE-family HTH domain